MNTAIRTFEVMILEEESPGIVEALLLALSNELPGIVACVLSVGRFN